ncbi:MAG: UDP-N-acetylglucosamine 3-dehydrogenase [Candidatus Poribacteria bacterium]|nr:UDP-N-acetylglucosamine 3-dehydrogenase [Candidatus Poribacteria bacterium]MDQ1329697.1 UDP-N-acetylglucosamine 3-dehydrogenase [Candidatus Poribacteria bacterium]
MNVKIGMISFAHMHAGSYANCLKQIDGVEIAGIYNEDESQGKVMAQRFESKFYPDYNKLLEQELDGVIVCSTNVDHNKHVISAANAGCKHILCEKPIATTLDDAKAMIYRCKESKTELGIAFPCRYIPAVINAKVAIDDASIGKILAVKTTNHGRMPGGWFIVKEKSGGGAVMDHTPHVVDLLRWFMKSDPIEVYAEIDNKFHNMDIDDTGILTIQFDNGVFTTLDTSWSRTKSYPTWGDVTMEIVGTEGVISVDGFAQDIDLYSDANNSAQWVYWGDNMDLFLVKDFIASVRGEKPFPIKGEDGLKALEVALAAYESAKIKSPIKI